MTSGVDIAIRGNNQAGPAIKQAESQLLSLKGIAQQLMAGFGLGLGSGIFQSIASGVSQAVRAGVAYNAVLETNAVAFKTLLGSAEAATARMKELQDFASATPFELPEIVNASRILQSLTDGAMASGEGLRLIGDAASAAGRSFEETAMWVGRLYGGLKSGTPVGEATMRLLEMGLVSGETKRRLDALAESGGVAGSALQVVTDTFSKTRGAMGEAATTLQGIGSTFRDMVKSDLASATAGITDALRSLGQAILEARGLIQSSAQLRDSGRSFELKGFAAKLGAIQNPADLAEVTRSIEAAREGYAATVAEWGKSIEGMTPGARAGLVMPPEIEAQMAQLHQLDLMLERARSNATQAKAAARWEGGNYQPNEEDIYFAKLDIKRSNDEILAQEKRLAEMSGEDEFYQKLAIDAYRKENELLEQQTREKERAVEQAAEEARLRAKARQEQAYGGSYLGGTDERWQRWQDSSAIDNAGGAGAGMVAGWKNAIMDLGTVAQNAGQMIQHVVGGAISSVSSGISGLIQGTMTWGQALRQIGGSIMNAVIDGIVRMFAAWIFQSNLKTTVETANATKEAAAKAPGSLMDSIASFGVAAAVGAAAFLAAMALTGGFAEGGYTGSGPVDQVAGVVHRGEYVIPADVVSRMGVRNLDAIAGAADIGGGTGMRSSGSGAPTVIHIQNHLDRQSLNDALRERIDSYAAEILGKLNA